MNEQQPSNNDHVRNPSDREGPMVTREHAAQIGSSMMDAAARVASGEPIKDFEPIVWDDSIAMDMLQFSPNTDTDTDVVDGQETSLIEVPDHLKVPAEQRWVPPSRSSGVTPR